jgi:hypothetical protein
MRESGPKFLSFDKPVQLILHYETSPARVICCKSGI